MVVDEINSKYNSVMHLCLRYTKQILVSSREKRVIVVYNNKKLNPACLASEQSM